MQQSHFASALALLLSTVTSQADSGGAKSPQEQLETFKLADGFVIELVASEEQGVINPIDLTFDDSGRLWTQTARMYPLDPVTGINFGKAMKMMRDRKAMAKIPRFAEVERLYRLEDRGTDQILIIDDPTVEQEKPVGVFADGLTIPQSILPYKDGVWVAHGSEMFFLKDSDGDDKSDEVVPTFSGFGFFDTHTMAHSLVRAPGGWFHFSHGLINSGDVTTVATGETTKIELCLIARFSNDGKKLEVVNRGLQNIWGYQLRADGQWWGTEANDLGYSIVPMEELSIFKGAQNPKIRPYQPQFPPPHSFRVGGTGISGLAFSEDEGGVGFPEEWRDVALLANPITNTINAVKVIRHANGTIEAEQLPDLLKCSDEFFRPVNIEFGPDGCLYVADWYNKIVSHNEVDTAHPDRDKTHGRIWRIRHVGQEPRKSPDLIAADPETLVEHLSSPYIFDKRAAWHQLVDRKATGQIPELKKIVADTGASKATRIHALWALEGLGNYEKELSVELIADADDDVSREAIRSLGTFALPPAELAGLVAPRLEDPTVTIRSQVLRTLGEARTADASVIELLVRACKPDIPGETLGGPYERKFERYLARMALERFPSELKTYLANPAPDIQPGNLLWAIQALDRPSKRAAFVDIWDKASGEELDDETFVAISGMLASPKIYEAVKPVFQDTSKAAHLVAQALANQSRVQSPELTRMITPLVARLLTESDTVALGLQAVSRFKMAEVDLPDEAPDHPRLLLAAQSINPKQYEARFVELAGDASEPFDLRADSLQALAPINTEKAQALTGALLSDASPEQKTAVADQFSQSKEGSAILCAMIGQDTIAPGLIDLSAAERIFQTQRRNPVSRKVLAAARKRVAERRKEAQGRIRHLENYIKENPGDASKGKLTFTTCLACHGLGSEGHDIAPALDGSGHRDLGHLLTAIVDPDAAVEGSYGLYRVTRTDGSVAEGYLDKKEALGTTIAMMGGARIFVPRNEIKNENFVGGRSFMIPTFGALPDDAMADLVAYIATLKEEPVSSN